MATSEFHENTALGRTIFAALDAGHPTRCPNIMTHPPPGWTPRDTQWKSFISVPVTYGGVLWGMLTADAPTPDAFDADDDAMAVALAHLFATALKA